jgi:hypothetical protein
MVYLLKARLAEPEETYIVREQNGNNTRPGVFYAVRATFPQQQGCMQQYAAERVLFYAVRAEAT